MQAASRKELRMIVQYQWLMSQLLKSVYRETSHVGPRLGPVIADTEQTGSQFLGLME